MRRRDVAVVLLSCFGLFLSLNDEGATTVAFRKAWLHPTSSTSPDSTLAEFDAAEPLPAPVVVRSFFLLE